MIRADPFIHLLLSYAAVTISIAFMPPTPMIRLGAFGGVLACVITGILYMDRSTSSRLALKSCAFCQCGVVLYANYFLLLMKATPPPGSSSIDRLKWTVDLVSNPRGIGTPWQARNLPAFSRKDPHYVPSRRRFIIQRIATGLTFYAMLKTFNLAQEKIYFANLQSGDYSEYKESIVRRIGEVSPHELFIRAWLPLSSFFALWCRYQYWHSSVSVIFVILGDEPRRWPPLYGSLRDAYSLRQFWRYGSVLFYFLFC